MSKKRGYHRELKRKAVTYKGGKCEICGYSKCLAALTFHHILPEDKSFNISHVLRILPWKLIKKELDKCFLLCANCHCEIHSIENSRTSFG